MVEAKLAFGLCHRPALWHRRKHLRTQATAHGAVNWWRRLYNCTHEAPRSKRQAEFKFSVQSQLFRWRCMASTYTPRTQQLIRFESIRFVFKCLDSAFHTNQTRRRFNGTSAQRRQRAVVMMAAGRRTMCMTQAAAPESQRAKGTPATTIKSSPLRGLATRQSLVLRGAGAAPGELTVRRPRARAPRGRYAQDQQKR
jgi:hypothetical protein